MSSSQIRIFYSWQSDLPSNQTRNLIQDSIDSVIKHMKDVVEIIADRDTKGEMGTPDIKETIFSKIDACDIFVADVSIINRYYPIDEEGNPISEVKTTPNPNVLFELGYAAQIIGWENIICVMNTDFGRVEELPFDIKQRRPLQYSLSKESKADVRKKIRDVISSTVYNLIENGKRVKGDFANHYIGSFDYEKNEVVRPVIPIKISEIDTYQNLRKDYLNKCSRLIEEINSIIVQKSTVEENDMDASSDSCIVTGVPNIFGEFHPVVISDEEKAEMKKDIKEYLNVEIDEEFFNIGSLKTKFDITQKTLYEGSEQEKSKYDKYCDLSYTFGLLSMLDMYVETFEDMILIPLAICNNSNFSDSNITVTVNIDTSIETVQPSVTLFNSKIAGLEGIVAKKDFPKLIFLMRQNEVISYESDISYDVISERKRNTDTSSFPNFNSWAEFDEDDYEREIQNYIATPIVGSNNVYVYHIDNLRAKESKWLGAAILVKKQDKQIHISYNIKSDGSNGELQGEISN